MLDIDWGFVFMNLITWSIASLLVIGVSSFVFGYILRNRSEEIDRKGFWMDEIGVDAYNDRGYWDMFGCFHSWDGVDDPWEPGDEWQDTLLDSEDDILNDL